MKRRTARAWVGLLLALLFAGAPAPAHAFGNWKSAISFGVSSSWNSATAGYSGAVQGLYSTAGGPVWHFASGLEVSMLSASTAPGSVFTQTFSATPTFTPTNGHTQIITLTANITGWTVVAGQPGDVLTLIFVQDATGSRTLAGTPANVSLAGTLTLSTAANARDSLTLRYDSISGIWQEIARGLASAGGGGGGSGNWVFSANQASVAGGYTLTGGAASTVTTTSGGLTLSAAGTVNVQNTSGAVVLGNTSGITTLRGGSTSLFDLGNGSGIFKTPTGAHTFGSASWSVPANLAVIGATSALNTVGMSFASNVNDGASTVVFDVNNGVAITNATASLFRIRNNGTSLLNTRVNSSDGFLMVDGGGVAKLALSTNAGAVFGYSSATFSAGSGSVTMTDATGSIGMSAGTLTLTIISGIADADGTRDWGTLATRWRIGGFKRLIQGEQNLSFSATPAFDCTAGNAIHIGTITGNITGPTMVSGSAGEQCTIVFQKDGTASAYTITASWGSNVRATASTFTTGAGSLVVLHFFWDANLTTPAWVLTSGLAYN